MSDFIREVDEGLRHDQFRRFLERYWIALAALVILVLAGVGAWEGYDYVRTERAQSSGGRYLDALDLLRDNKAAEGDAALRAVVADGTAGYKLLARFRLAGATGDKDKAAGATLFDALAADPAIDPAFQNVAKLRAAVLLLDTAGYPDIKHRLEPLTDANSPTRNTARELLALAALKADQTADAGRALDAIDADPTASGQLRQRVAALQGLVHGADKAAQTPAGLPQVPAMSPVPAAPAAQAPADPAPPSPAPAMTSAPAAPEAPAPAVDSPAVPPVMAPATPAPDPAAPSETPAK